MMNYKEKKRPDIFQKKGEGIILQKEGEKRSR